MFTGPFICGASDNVDSGGLADSYSICPEYGSDYAAIYIKSPIWHAEYHGAVTGTKAVVALTNRISGTYIIICEFDGQYWHTPDINSSIPEDMFVAYSTDLYKYLTQRSFWPSAAE